MDPFTVVITDLNTPGNDIESSVFANSGLAIDLVRLRASPSAGSLAAAVRDADALLVQFATIDRPLLESMTSCRVIARYGIGVDMIDVDAASALGIPVANVPDYCIDEVSTQTIGFIIDLDRHTIDLSAHVRSGEWGRSTPRVQAPRRIHGQVLGIIGLGHIGRAVAAKARAIGLNIIATDPYTPAAAAADLGVRLVALDDLLAQSDYVSVHCPLVPETHGLIGAGQLATMKREAYLINMARGAIVDQQALTQALRDGEIAGAALDVLETEPPSPDEPLLTLPNVIVTPHSSSWSAESVAQLRRDSARNVVDALAGRMPRSVVNAKALGHRGTAPRAGANAASGG